MQTCGLPENTGEPFIMALSKYERNRRYAQRNPEKRREWQRQAVARGRQYVMDNYHRSCLFCGAVDNIEYHHVNANDSEKRIGSVYNSSLTVIDSVMSDCWCLCHTCHKSLHRGLVQPMAWLYDIKGRDCLDL